MVGKFDFGGLRKRLVQTVSHDSHESHDDRQVYAPMRRGVPIIASPLDPKASDWLKRKNEAGNLTLKRRPTIAQYEAHRFAGGIFRKQHEASTLELFFDLFFVANLSVFTSNYQHSTGSSIGNYIGFVGILWSTWFNYSIYDVRFYVDSMFNRFCKLFSFGVMVSLTGLAPIYDVITNGGVTRAFQGLALVLMACRLMIMLQYMVVLYFVRPFKKTVIPLVLMIIVYLCTAMGFLGTYLHNPGEGALGATGGNDHVVVWYVIMGVEAGVVLLISSVWRVLSFKHTHLVERVGLLTLIVMGEGIIGCTKAVAYILAGMTITVWEVLGKVIAVVLLIYLIYVLYFSPIDHDRFGTIRQQVWTILHFPLHVAILLAQEGAAITLLWSAVINARQWLKLRWPDLSVPSAGYASATAVVTSVNQTLIEAGTRYSYAKLKEVYDYSPDLKALASIKATYNTTEWDDAASEILSNMFNSTTNFFFENFNYEVTYAVLNEEDPNAKTLGYFKAERVTFTSFYISSGCIFLLMAAMYWLGKNNKSKEEWAAIMLRIAIGVGVPFLALIVWLEPLGGGFMYYSSGWIVSIVTLIFLFVTFVDDLLGNRMDRKHPRPISTDLHGSHHGHGSEHAMEEGKMGPRGPQTYKQEPGYYNTVERSRQSSDDLNGQHLARGVPEESNFLMSENETLQHHHHDNDGGSRRNSTAASPPRIDTHLSANSERRGVTFDEPTMYSPVTPGNAYHPPTQ